MNERIRELIREAESTTNEGIGFEGQEYLDMLMERFAELIVKECATVAYNKQYKHSAAHTRGDCAEAIKKHFGGEE
jgi:hypothetical protein